MVHAVGGQVALQAMAACVDDCDYAYQYTTVVVRAWDPQEYPMRIAVPVPLVPGRAATVVPSNHPISTSMRHQILQDLRLAKPYVFAASQNPTVDPNPVPPKKAFEDTDRGKYEWLEVEVDDTSDWFTIRHPLPFSSQSLSDSDRVPLYYPVEVDLASLVRAYAEYDNNVVTVVSRPHSREYLVLSSTPDSNNDLFLPSSIPFSVPTLHRSFGPGRTIYGPDGAIYHDRTSNHAVRFEFVQDACCPLVAGMPLSLSGKQLLLRGHYGLMYLFRDWVRGAIAIQEVAMEPGQGGGGTVRRQWVVDCDRWMPLRFSPPSQALLVNELPLPS